MHKLDGPAGASALCPVPEQPCTCSQRRKHSPVLPTCKKCARGSSDGTVSGTRVALSGRHSTRLHVRKISTYWVTSSRLRLTWASGAWLEVCPQVKRRVPTFVLAA